MLSLSSSGATSYHDRIKSLTMAQAQNFISNITIIFEIKNDISNITIVFIIS